MFDHVSSATSAERRFFRYDTFLLVVDKVLNNQRAVGRKSTQDLESLMLTGKILSTCDLLAAPKYTAKNNEDDPNGHIPKRG